jgi:ribosomal protein S18 acetylase RimI-like enzyme
MEISIRKAHAFEFEILTSLAIAAKSYWGYSDEFIQACRHELTTTETDLLNPFYTYWLAYYEDTICGYAALKPLSLPLIEHLELSLDDQLIELDGLWVLPEFIGQGIGSKLFRHFMPLLKASSYTHLEILSDPQASGFYEKMGGTYVGDKSSNFEEGRLLPVFRMNLRK